MQWVVQSLGDHAQASRRLLDNAGRLPLDAGQSQLVNWLAASQVNDPVIAQQGAVLLLASLNNAQPQVVGGRRLPYAALNAHIDQYAAYPLQVADLARIAGLSSARLHARFVAECGQTPMDYIRSRRLAHGRRHAAGFGVAHRRDCQSGRLQLAECLRGRGIARIWRLAW